MAYSFGMMCITPIRRTLSPYSSCSVQKAGGNTAAGAVLNKYAAKDETLIEVLGLVSFVQDINANRTSRELEKADVECASTSVVVVDLANPLERRVTGRVVDRDSAGKNVCQQQSQSLGFCN
jgi:hypothetical protein